MLFIFESAKFWVILLESLKLNTNCVWEQVELMGYVVRMLQKIVESVALIFIEDSNEVFR